MRKVLSNVRQENKKKFFLHVTILLPLRNTIEQEQEMTTEEYQNEAAHLRPSLLSEAMQYVRRDDVAEDIVQDCLVRLWDRCGQLRSPMAPLARVVTRNLCLDFIRRTPHTKDVSLMGKADDTDDTAQHHEAVERMMDIVTELPIVGQTVLRMRHIEGREMGDIAHTLGMTEAAVRKALSRARMAVRERYLKRFQQNEI